MMFFKVLRRNANQSLRLPTRPVLLALLVTAFFLVSAASNATELRTLRLAVSVTNGLRLLNGDSGSDTTITEAEIASLVAKLNAFSIPEAAVAFELVPNNASLISTDAFDALSLADGVPTTLSIENASWTQTILGPGTFDVAVALGRFPGGGISVNGLSAQGAACGPLRGRVSVLTSVPFSASPPSVGESFFLHSVAHTLDARHVWNSELSLCLDGRDAANAYEPGAGSTLLARSCGADTVELGNAYLHSVNLERFASFLASRPSCGTTTSTSNTTPSVSAGVGGWTIPAATPFALTGTASESDGDAMTYTWEQLDLAGQGSSLADGDLGDVPLFRSQPPATSLTRSFPADPLTPGPGEILPTTTRNLTFRFIGRDNAVSGGAWDFDEISVAVDSGAGPFLNTTSPTWAWPSKQVTWDVAGTDLPPVSCTAVDILLSRDGGASFDEALLLSTPNDGMERIVMPPATVPTSARVRIRCADNVFFSDAIATLEPFSFAPYQFLLDRLEIHHSGGVVFVDEFDDDVPPPSLGYFVEGTVGPEASDFLLLDEVNAISGFPESYYQAVGRIVDAPLDKDFSVSSRYKFAPPNPLRKDAQSVFLTYEDPITKEEHRVVASFTSRDFLPLALQVRDENLAAGLEVVLAEADVSSVVDTGLDQVELRLEVEAGTNFAVASLVGFDNGIEAGSVSIPNVALVPGEVIPSAGIQVSVVPEPSLLLGLVAGVFGMSVFAKPSARVCSRG